MKVRRFSLIGLIGIWCLLVSTAALGPAWGAAWQFAVIGDNRGPDNEGGINLTVLDSIAKDIQTRNVEYILCGGDQINGGGTQADMTQKYQNWKNVFSKYNLLDKCRDIRGNHECFADPGVDWRAIWTEERGQFLPQNGPDNQKGATYSFFANNVFFVGLDQFVERSPTRGYVTSIDLNWLNAQLAANTLPHVIVYGHYPAFGPGGDSLVLKNPTDTTVRDAFWRSLANTGSKVYFTGHVHLYDYGLVSKFDTTISQMVIGAGGAPPEDAMLDYNDPNVKRQDAILPEKLPDSWSGPTSAWYLKNQQGYALVTVDGPTITIEYYYMDANVIWRARSQDGIPAFTYNLTSRPFGADNANQAIDPATLTNYYHGIALMKIGLGTLTLNAGASNYADAITVAAGLLNVQGDYSKAPVLVQSGAFANLESASKVAGVTIDPGGILSGTGTVVGRLSNSGTMSPGHSPGTLNVIGSFTQTASGTYIAEIASPSSYDRIAVSGNPGTASLAGTLSPVLLSDYRPPGNTVFPGIVMASGGISGTFSSIADQLLSPTLVWHPRYNANSVDLVVQRDYANPGLRLNSNQLAVGTMLNSVAGVTSGDLNNVLNAVDSLSNTAAVQDAFKQISPEKAGALANLGFAAANFQVRNLASRTTNLRFVQGESGGPASSLTPGGLSCNYSRQSGVMLAYSGGFLPDLFTARRDFKAPESRWGIFADGGAAFGTQSSTSNQTGYNFTLGGLTLGADYRVTDQLLVGLATGYSNTASSFYGTGGSVTVNSVPFNAYAAYFSGPLYAYGSIGYALNLYNLRRSINFDGIGRTAASSTTGNQFNLYGETGYDLKFRQLILTPAVTLTYSALWLGGFSEQDAGALNLRVGPQNASSVQTGVGGRITVPLRMGRILLAPQAYAFYQHEFANGGRGLNASLSQGSSSFTWQTDAAGQNFALVGASLTAGLRENLYAQVNFNAEVGRRNATAQFFNVGLRYEF
jgi:uncharacterized protein with beta-barrel porin domain